jgi:two-component system, NtrC family, response regulator AtoC
MTELADVLVVEDEPALAERFARFLERNGHTVRRASSGEAALQSYLERRPDVTLLDLQLPDMTGFDVFARMREDEPMVIMISERAELPLAVRAVHEGVEDFLTKPVELAQLDIALGRALEKLHRRQHSRYLSARRASSGSLAIGSSPRMRELASQVELLSASDRTTVLLSGEGGTGKGGMASLIHAQSPRAHRPFVEVSCAGQRAESLEVELFGLEDPTSGASRPGLVEVATGGTIFLDEVGELPTSLQPKLLRVLEGKPYRRVGGTREISVDVRVVAATTRDLASEVNAGRFREDLYYRLNVMPLNLPPLRTRERDDLIELIARLMDELAPHLVNAPREVSEAALDRLLRYAWPGNIRQLRNVLERGMIVSGGESRLDVASLPPEVRESSANAAKVREEARSLAGVERMHIEQTLRAHAGNRTHAARELGISRATLIKKIKTYKLAATTDK